MEIGKFDLRKHKEVRIVKKIITEVCKERLSKLHKNQPKCELSRFEKLEIVLQFAYMSAII